MKEKLLRFGLSYCSLKKRIRGIQLKQWIAVKKRKFTGLEIAPAQEISVFLIFRVFFSFRVSLSLFQASICSQAPNGSKLLSWKSKVFCRNSCTCKLSLINNGINWTEFCFLSDKPLLKLYSVHLTIQNGPGCFIQTKVNLTAHF